MQEAGLDMFAQLEEHGNPCGGFLYLLPTTNLIAMWDLIIAMFREHITWIENHSSKRDPVEYAKFLHQQKHSHEQKYLAVSETSFMGAILTPKEELQGGLWLCV